MKPRKRRTDPEINDVLRAELKRRPIKRDKFDVGVQALDVHDKRGTHQWLVMRDGECVAQGFCDTYCDGLQWGTIVAEAMRNPSIHDNYVDSLEGASLRL